MIPWESSCKRWTCKISSTFFYVAYFDKEGDTAGAGESRKCSRRASTVDQPIDDYNDEGYDEDFGMMSDGDVSVCSSSEESEDKGKDNEIPDGIILDLYEEMQE